MGKKTHPLIFRTKYKFSSVNWVNNTKNYNDFVQLDKNLRSFIINYLTKYNFVVYKIYIFRKQTEIKGNTQSLYITIKLKQNKIKQPIYNFNNFIFILKEKIIYKFFKKEQKNILVNINLITSKEKFLILNLFFNFISKIKKGLSVKLLTNLFINKIKNIKKIGGVKITISGRIHGIEKAKSISMTSGFLKTQTIKTKVCLLQDNITTKDGLLGIKLLYNII